MNPFEQRSIDSYNKMADHYDHSPEGIYTQKFKLLLLQQMQICDGDIVLDIACGNGRLLKMLSERYKIVGYGSDISEKMIAQAKILNPQMQFFVGNCEHIPLPDHTVDKITVCAAYHHFPNVHKFIAEAHRLIKPCGTIDIAEIYYPAVIRALINPFVPLSKSGDVKFYSPKEIRQTLQNVGFTIEKHTIDGYVQNIQAKRS